MTTKSEICDLPPEVPIGLCFSCLSVCRWSCREIKNRTGILRRQVSQTYTYTTILILLNLYKIYRIKPSS